MTSQPLDHERLDVHRLSIDYVARYFAASQSLAASIATPAISGFVLPNRFH
jgi:hypothetical protein